MKLPMPDSKHEFTPEEVKHYFPINNPRMGWHQVFGQFILLLPNKSIPEKVMWHVYVYFRDPRPEFSATATELNQISKLAVFTLPE